MDPQPLYSDAKLREIFAQEWTRLDASEYGGKLGAFPGVEINRRTAQYGYAKLRRQADGTRVCASFGLSRWISSLDQILATIRHEIAHATAWMIDGDSSHGYHWKVHAVRCGTTADRCGPSQHVGMVKQGRKTAYATVECRNCHGRKVFYRASKRATFLVRAANPKNGRLPWTCQSCGTGELFIEKHREKGEFAQPPRAKKQRIDWSAPVIPDE